MLCECTKEKITLIKVGDEKSFCSAHRVKLERKIWQTLERTPRGWGWGWKGDERRSTEIPDVKDNNPVEFFQE